MALACSIATRHRVFSHLDRTRPGPVYAASATLKVRSACACAFSCRVSREPAVEGTNDDPMKPTLDLARSGKPGLLESYPGKGEADEQGQDDEGRL